MCLGHVGAWVVLGVPGVLGLQWAGILAGPIFPAWVFPSWFAWRQSWFTSQDISFDWFWANSELGKWDVSYSWIIWLGADELAKVKFGDGGIGDLLDISDFLAYQAMFGCTGNSKTMRQDLKQFHPRFTGSHHLLMILLIQTTGKRKFRLQQKSLKDFCLHQAERRETAMSQFVRDIPLKQIGGAPRRWVMPLPWEPSPAPWVATRKLWRNYPSTTFDYPWTSFDYPLSTLPKNLGLFWDVPGVTLNSFLWQEFHWVWTDSDWPNFPRSVWSIELYPLLF